MSLSILPELFGTKNLAVRKFWLTQKREKMLCPPPKKTISIKFQVHTDPHTHRQLSAENCWFTYGHIIGGNCIRSPLFK